MEHCSRKIFASFLLLTLAAGPWSCPAQDAGSAKVPGSMWGNAAPFVAEPGHEAIPLWPNLPPDAAANASTKTAQSGKGNRTRSITVPQLLPYFPATKPTGGTAIIYCPGGGYGYVAVGQPSTGMAAYWNPKGVTIFVLMYRQKGTKPTPEIAREDGQRAVRLVRSRATEWGLDPNRIGLGGASAGANLALHLMADFDKPAVHPPSEDAVDAFSGRPDFCILISCWAGHSESSPYQMVKNSPPCFIGHAKNDNLAKIGVSIDVNKQLTDLGVPVLYKEYDKGGHGLRGIPWQKDFIPWLQGLGKLDAKVTADPPPGSEAKTPPTGDEPPAPGTATDKPEN